MSLASPGLWLVSYLWDWDFCTVASVLGGRHSHEAHLCNEQVVSLGRTGAQGAPQLWHRCAAAPQATAASQKWVLEHFSDSPFKRQNLRLGSLGTELNSTKEIVI